MGTWRGGRLGERGSVGRSFVGRDERGSRSDGGEGTVV